MLPARPEARCQVCGTVCRFEKYTLFAYFYCPQCKDEKDVNLSTVFELKGVKYPYAPKADNDIYLREPGLYRVVYTDGSYEFYERKGGSDTVPVRLSGDRVRTAARVAESDMPSRKPLQSLSVTSEGEEAQRQGLRALSDAQDSNAGTGTDKIVVYDSQDYRDYLCARVSPASPLIYFLPNGSYVPVYNEDQMRQLAKGIVFLEYGQVPPEDTL